MASESSEAKGGQNYSPYDEASVAFPDNLSKSRYIAFNFYSNNFSGKIGDLIADLSVYAVKSVDTLTPINPNFTDDLATVSTTIAPKISKLFGGDNDISKILEKVGARATKATKEKEATLSKTTTSEFDKGFDARNAIEGSEFKFAIYLPLVNAFREQVAHNWDSQKGYAPNQIGELVPKKVKDSLAGISNMFGARTLMINPDWVQSYQGTALRSFVFTWVLMPNTVKEAQTIFNIVRKFKRGASPERSSKGLTLLPPLFCSISFTNETIENSIRMEEMVITAINVNYSESGFMETFKDGIPKAISLELGIAERRMRTEKDWSPRVKEGDFSKYTDVNDALTDFQSGDL